MADTKKLIDYIFVKPICETSERLREFALATLQVPFCSYDKIKSIKNKIKLRENIFIIFN